MYAQPPTARASIRPAVSRSARLARAINPSSSAAVSQTPRKTSNGTAERRESSSSGSASLTAGPGSAEWGWITYSQPVAATMTARETIAADAGRTTLSMRQPLRRSEVRAPGHPAPEPPVVSTAELEVDVRNVRGRQGLREDTVLLPQ